MAPGKGSAVAMGLLPLFCLLAHSEVAGAATFVVGDSRGWTFSTAGWPSGKRFRAGRRARFSGHHENEITNLRRNVVAE
ncbi:hypothetical protein OPV22_020616 [Ensete ventricosum]|uniref:Phytocyanin domain-containing protein n=1 Tax=Ensete ventricosum TaxID=4639 RepID=A0AAV8QQ72_ENSVE|nr:hypothetical protein OPV22_020616 [Ensete ventricosum]